MKQVIEINEVVETIELAEGTCEVCASASAHFDEATPRLVVDLDCFLRTTDLRSPERQFGAGWLPKKESLKESAGLDEAVDLTKDIFRRWVRKVRQSIPPRDQR